MTREEAIHYIRNDAHNNLPKFNEALDMAIKALEQEPCEDYISRQAIHELIDTYYPMLSGFKKPIDDLPSVQSMSVLEDIKAEIEEYFQWGDISSTDQKALLKIIDKHISGKEKV